MPIVPRRTISFFPSSFPSFSQSHLRPTLKPTSLLFHQRQPIRNKASPSISISIPHNTITRSYTQSSKMSGITTSSSYSNTNTGSKPADPYKEANVDCAPLKERVEDLINFIEGHKFCLMTTRQNDSGYLVSRCMAVAAHEGMDLFFHTNTESGKTDELVGDPHVNIGFLKESNGDWASVSGTAEIISDREVVKKYYSSQLKAWVGDLGDGVHNGGPSDPRVGVIKVRVRTATYSLAQGNTITRSIEVAKGSITGKPAHVNKLRELTEGDLETYRKSLNLIS